jgi:hypothetical protein
MQTKEIIKSQYHASLKMLQQAVEKCPQELWANNDFSNPFWHVVYHALFYTYLYLNAREEEFTPWVKQRQGYHRMSGEEAKNLTPYTQEEMLEFLNFCQEQAVEKVDTLDLEAGSGFEWLPFNKLELQFYNIRHIMQHTGELSERLGARGEVEVSWVGMKPAG